MGERGIPRNMRVHMLAIPCYHCQKPMCLPTCPNKAIFKEERYGAVLIDTQKMSGGQEMLAGLPIWVHHVPFRSAR